MPTYYFELGHQPHISIAEILFTLSKEEYDATIEKETKQYIIVSTKRILDTPQIMAKLGGTKKISEAIPKTEGSIQDRIIEYLQQTTPEGKIHFSLSGEGAKPFALQVKKELKALGRSVRFIEAKNTATIKNNSLIRKQGDLLNIKDTLFVTRAIQPFEDFAKRDYGRPRSDDKSGMLPPKLAKILINLSEIQPNETLLDAFCGSGTVLMEALSSGIQHIIGTDISIRAVRDSEANMSWLEEQVDTNATVTIFQHDATTKTKKIAENTIDAIVSEPYMGKPLTGKEGKQLLTKQAKELRQLFVKTFKQFHRIVKPGGIIIFIVPQFHFHNEWITINCKNDIEQLGFTNIPLTKDSESLLYRRAGQHIGRSIWKWEKN
ncbi:MAG: methyltransferase domain-containing protein [Candidatus Magasanikbacteria bacterium]|jgi:tRNA G10  N-methylase Trm11|nr:methyltransferase domain-containing protein [Candidatus Magasanikbacteria bacterium]MBT4220984.1 methyltransferase domain-containing protein [Candidatus Magasanikbacteria bacterium]MBT4350502.1 methyltransferase domain-containing protein [Candidatus Magasanikbacteria bacterium]MBT4541945.1 methyltransferase domain-containing protein [Candidatus Magasanikbacteria bacterium]MBT6252889.1 methyltransferase domain-containing protein [Candidatus Magasanikbacteria bacterium]